MSQTPKYASLQDYLRVIKSHRALIILVAGIFAVVGLGLSLMQTPLYTAEASLTFRDVERDLTLLGDSAIPELAPDQRAAVNSELVTRPSVARKVEAELDTEIGDAQGSVSTQVGARTNFVVIQATSDDAQFSAELANEYARQVQLADRAEVRGRLQRAINSLRQGLSSTPSVNNDLTVSRINQLETARELAEPVEIARPAEAPGSPSTPRTRRNTALGLVVGLAFGLIAAFLRESLDRRLRVSDDVRDAMQLPVVGRIPDAALGDVAFVGNGDASPESQADLEAFRVLRTNLDFLRRGDPLRSVLITSGLPDEGKSTVSVALASAAAVGGKRTLLVECDLRRPVLAERLGLEESPGLADYLMGEAEPADVLQVVKLSPMPTGPNGAAAKSRSGGKASATETIDGPMMVCITAGSTAPLPAEMLGSARFTQFLEKVSKAYEFVVLDSSPILSVVDALELVPQVDGLVVCVRLSQTTRQEARATLDALSHLPDRPTGIVVTGVRPGEDSYGYYYGAYGLDS